jgi:hypothetical protein
MNITFAPIDAKEQPIIGIDNRYIGDKENCSILQQITDDYLRKLLSLQEEIKQRLLLQLSGKIISNFDSDMCHKCDGCTIDESLYPLYYT